MKWTSNLSDYLVEMIVYRLAGIFSHIMGKFSKWQANLNTKQDQIHSHRIKNLRVELCSAWRGRKSAISCIAQVCLAENLSLDRWVANPPKYKSKLDNRELASRSRIVHIYSGFLIISTLRRLLCKFLGYVACCLVNYIPSSTTFVQ